jgi:shikimate dehydrogenase
MRKYGLIGYPLGHSFSKAFFDEKFNKEKIDDVEYLNFPLEKVEDFEALCKEDPTIRGFNVTIPYKESIVKYLDALSDAAREVRAVNTICYCKKSDHKALIGHNTDVTGFRKSLNEQIAEAPKKALVLGTGGSSKAVKYVLEELGTEIISVSSSGKEGAIAYNDLTKDLIDSVTLIINTTPLGMYPNIDQCPDIPYEFLGEKHLLFDLVYNPDETLFMKKGAEQKAKIVNGYDMLVYQAEASWDIWNRNK